MITGDRVILKGVTKADVNLIYEWVNTEQLRSLTGTLYPVSEYEHEKWIEKQLTNSSGKLFMIYKKDSDSAIGTIGLKNIDYVNSNAELYISLGQSGGGGYGTDAVCTLISFAFMHLNIHRIYLHVFESNTKAIHCYEKAGLRREGILRDHHWQNGQYENVIVMGVVYAS